MSDKVNMRELLAQVQRRLDEAPGDAFANFTDSQFEDWKKTNARSPEARAKADQMRQAAQARQQGSAQSGSARTQPPPSGGSSSGSSSGARTQSPPSGGSGSSSGGTSGGSSGSTSGGTSSQPKPQSPPPPRTGSTSLATTTPKPAAGSLLGTALRRFSGPVGLALTAKDAYDQGPVTDAQREGDRQAQAGAASRFAAQRTRGERMASGETERAKAADDLRRGSERDDAEIAASSAARRADTPSSTPAPAAPKTPAGPKAAGFGLSGAQSSTGPVAKSTGFDGDKKPTFGQAFAAARKEAGGAGGKFTFQGKEYQTNVAGEKYRPAGQLKPVGEKPAEKPSTPSPVPLPKAPEAGSSSATSMAPASFKAEPPKPAEPPAPAPQSSDSEEAKKKTTTRSGVGGGLGFGLRGATNEQKETKMSSMIEAFLKLHKKESYDNIFSEAKKASRPDTPKEKELAALGHPKDKITHKDVLIGRGVLAKESSEGTAGAVKRDGKDVVSPTAPGGSGYKKEGPSDADRAALNKKIDKIVKEDSLGSIRGTYDRANAARRDKEPGVIQYSGPAMTMRNAGIMNAPRKSEEKPAEKEPAGKITDRVPSDKPYGDLEGAKKAMAKKKEETNEEVEQFDETSDEQLDELNVATIKSAIKKSEKRREKVAADPSDVDSKRYDKARKSDDYIRTMGHSKLRSFSIPNKNPAYKGSLGYTDPRNPYNPPVHAKVHAGDLYDDKPRKRVKSIKKEEVEFSEAELTHIAAIMEISVPASPVADDYTGSSHGVSKRDLTDETMSEEEAMKRGRGRPAGKYGAYKRKDTASADGEEEKAEPKNLVAQNPRTYNKDGKNMVDLEHPSKPGVKRTVPAKHYDDFRSSYLNAEKPAEKQRMHDSMVDRVFGKS